MSKSDKEQTARCQHIGWLMFKTDKYFLKARKFAKVETIRSNEYTLKNRLG